MPIRVNGHFYLPSKSTHQSLLDYIVDISRISMSTENHLHVTFEPTQDTLREFEFNIDAGLFQQLQIEEESHIPSINLRKFYENNVNRFQLAYPEESAEVIFTNYINI